MEEVPTLDSPGLRDVFSELRCGRRSDLERLPLPSARAIEISEFVPLAGIQGALYLKAATTNRIRD